MKTGIELIRDERQRQKDAEGHTKQHDAEHILNELCYASAYYLSPETLYVKRENTKDPSELIYFHDCWPTNWDRKWAKKEKHSRLRQLVIAGALIAAEIDRLQDLDNKE